MKSIKRSGNSNWRSLKAKFSSEENPRKETSLKKPEVTTTTQRGRRPQDELSPVERAKYVGLDCEMVGLGPTGKTSALALPCLSFLLIGFYHVIRCMFTPFPRKPQW